MNVSKWIILFLCFSTTLSFAQEKESDRLKKEQEELKKKIEYTQTLLQSTTSDKENLTNTLGLIDLKIEYRKALLDNLDNQLNEIIRQIEAINEEIAQLEIEIEKQKEQYREMLQLAYKMRNQKASLIYVLSSESINQANKRMEYLEQLRKYRADQIRKIQANVEKLKQQRTELENLKLEKENLLTSKDQERKKYVQDRENQKKTILSLEGKEQQLLDELEAQKQKSKDIQKAINAAINKEILAEKKKNKDKPPTVKETKEVALNTSNFESNKGRLPWPVTAGEITRGYGKQPHPVHINVFTYNNGVDITTVKGSTVRAVFSGKVSSVLIIPGAGKAVIIAHGDYRTIYSNLQETYVEAGDDVNVKQEIGALLVNANGNSEVHFEIRKITADGQITNINPTYWLAQ